MACVGVCRVLGAGRLWRVGILTDTCQVVEQIVAVICFPIAPGRILEHLGKTPVGVGDRAPFSSVLIRYVSSVVRIDGAHRVAVRTSSRIEAIQPIVDERC